MIIREIKETDNKKIEHIIKESLVEFDLDIPGTAYYDPRLGKLTSLYKTQPHAKYWVAVNKQNEVVGGIGIAPYNEKRNVCELQKLYIDRKAQGQGLSKGLMNVALDFASIYYSYCYIQTMEKLSIANLLYRKFGFQELEHPLDENEHSIMDKWYIKEL